MTRAWRLATAALAIALCFAIVRLSWLGDDALITFRSVENLVNGHGPVWNVDERVQTYTHPLWFALVAGLRALTGECAITSQLLGIALSLAAALWAARLAGSAATAAVTLAMLLCSRAWTNYATSGLETSLTYLLIVALFAAVRLEDRERRLRRAAIVCGLLTATRFDLLLLGLPVVVAACRGVRISSAARALALGFALPAAWCAFATVYYGTPFPITAYAKAFCHGIPALDLAAQGMRYVWRNLVDDPLTVLAIPAGIGLGFARQGTRALGFGALLYTVYVVRVGGDYMLGRFLVPSFTAGTLLCMSALAGRSARVHAAVIVAAALLAFAPGVPEAARPMPATDPGYPLVDGIVDEQIPGHWDHGLLAPSAKGLQPGFVTEVLRERGIEHRVFTVGGAIGWLGLASGPQVHVIDPWLCDPLLMRLPLADPGRWRPGHFCRRIPAGYLESLANGDNRIHHPGIARLHDAVRSMTRDPIWSAARWAHLLDLWLGRLDAGLADYVRNEYRSPPRLDVPFAAIATPPPPGSSWFEVENARTAQAGGLAVRFDGPATASNVVAHLTGAVWRLKFERDGDITGTVEVRIAQPPDLLQPQSFAVPAGASPFDAILVDAIVDLESPAAACIAAIELVP